MVQLLTYQHEGLSFDVDDNGVDGDTVILLHGFPQTRTSWHRVTPALTQFGYRVLAPDQRGYSPGARPAGRRAYTLDKLVGDVVALADAAGVDRFHVVGHDWGGAVAWGLGAAHPERLASLTSLATPHGRAMAGSLVRSTQLLRSWYMLAFQLPGLPERMLRADGGRRMRTQLLESGLAEAQVDESVELMTSGGATPAINWYRAMPFSPPRLAAKVSVPTLYVYGAKDFALGRSAADLTGRHVTGPYQYEVFEDTGHWIPEQAADRLNAVLLEHLAAHPVGTIGR
jgi:pimeloyl-ACP methyl ester carboxylesterase